MIQPKIQQLTTNLPLRRFEILNNLSTLFYEVNRHHTKNKKSHQGKKKGLTAEKTVHPVESKSSLF